MLHPEFVDGQYALYTRPQDGFIEAGTGGGIGFGLSRFNGTVRLIHKKWIVDKRVYHTISELKNGLGPQPVKTSAGLGCTWRTGCVTRLPVCDMFCTCS